MFNFEIGPPGVAVRQRLFALPPLLGSVDAVGWSGQASAALALPAMTSDGSSEFGADGVAPKTVMLARQGYDATGAAVVVSEALTITKRVRQPWPNHTSATATTVALADYVYATDTIAGASNGSVAASPRPVANWIMPDRAVVGSSLAWEIAAFHRNARSGREVACVVVTATDGTTSVSQTVAATSVSGRTGDRYAVPCFRGTIDISTLAAGLVTLNAKVYPWIGAAASVRDSAASSERRGFSPRYFRKDSGATVYAYVASTGNDTSGVASTTAATAAAAPCLTVCGALAKIASAGTRVDLGEVRVVDTVAMGTASATIAQQISAPKITRAPGSTRAAAIVQWTASATRPRLGAGSTINATVAEGSLRFTDLTISRTGAGQWGNSADPGLMLILDDVDIDNGAQGAISSATGGVSLAMYGVTAANASGAWLGGSTTEVRCIRGFQGDCGSAGVVEAYLVVGSKFQGLNNSSAVKDESGSIRFHSSFTLKGSGIGVGYGSGTIDVTGAVQVGCIVEDTRSAAQAGSRMSGDGSLPNMTHIIVRHCTHAGFFVNGRNNDFYDETTGPNVYRTHSLLSVTGNIFVQMNNKSDWKVGANDGNPEGFTGASPSTRTGSWSFLYGVGCQGNLTQFTDASSGGLGSSFAQAWPGGGCRIGTSATVRQDPLFTSNQGAKSTFEATGSGSATTVVAGAGAGDYAIGALSPAKAIVAGRVRSHDLAGTVSNGAGDSAGAYF